MADARSEHHPSVRTSPSGTPARTEERRRGNFCADSWAELKTVEWPSQQQVISGTAVVLIACLIVGVYLYGNDQLWSYVVKHILLR